MVYRGQSLIPYTSKGGGFPLKSKKEAGAESVLKWKSTGIVSVSIRAHCPQSSPIPFVLGSLLGLVKIWSLFEGASSQICSSPSRVFCFSISIADLGLNCATGQRLLAAFLRMEVDAWSPVQRTRSPIPT